MKIAAATLLFLAPSAINAFAPGKAMAPAFTQLNAVPGDPAYNYGATMDPKVAGPKTGAPPGAGRYVNNLENRLNALDKKGPIGAPQQSRGPHGRTSTRSKGAPVTVQGGSLKTWAFANPAVERVQVVLGTEGRPLDADVELWQGPDNTPHKMRVYVEDGSKRPFNAIIETPRGPNTIAIRNIGQMEFPMVAQIAEADRSMGPLDVPESSGAKAPMTVQGGALRTYPFEPAVESVQVLLKTDGRPLNARIELLQGPNNNKQVIELYTEDGMDRPFFAVIETPGSGNVVRIVNTATVEFPMTAWVAPYSVGNFEASREPVVSEDNSVMDRKAYGPPQW